MRRIAPSPLSGASDRLGWAGLQAGLQAARFRGIGTCEINVPPQAQHALILIFRSPEQLDVRFEGVKRDIPPPPGSMLLVPAHSAVRWRWSGSKDSLHIFLEPSLIARVAAESFELDPSRTEILPLHGLNVPELRAAMLAVNAELMAGGAGGPLVIESLANAPSGRKP